MTSGILTFGAPGLALILCEIVRSLKIKPMASKHTHTHTHTHTLTPPGPLGGSNINHTHIQFSGSYSGEVVQSRLLDWLEGNSSLTLCFKWGFRGLEANSVLVPVTWYFHDRHPVVVQLLSCV